MNSEDETPEGPKLTKLEQLRAKYHVVEPEVVQLPKAKAPANDADVDPKVYRAALLVECLDVIWSNTPKTKSDFAREYANEIAELCSGGCITTKLSPTPAAEYGTTWKVTPNGLRMLYLLAPVLLGQEAQTRE